MQDACDPDSFNAVIGAGACVRNGGMKFDAFIEQLTKLGFVGPWHFAPKSVTARTGQEFLVMNQGGETHTFTEVEEFGGGIVADLNERMHLSTVAPECKALESGHEKYQCCIHPWMRLEANITEAQGR
jgi:hypothetical protein